MTRPQTHDMKPFARQCGALIAIALLGLILRIVYSNLAFDQQGHLDWPEYQQAALQILGGDFAFSSEAFQLRPPVFPMLIAALDLEKPLLRAVNILFSIACIPLTYALARIMRSGHLPALLAAALVALDPASVKYAGSILAEPLANLLLAIVYLCLFASASAKARRATVVWGFAAGLSLVVSALTRPSAYLLWIPLGLWIVFARRRKGAQILAAFALIAPAALGVSVWKYHNAVHYGNSSFTSVGTFNMLHHRAASVLYQAKVKDIKAVHLILVERVESKLGNDLAGLTSHDHWNHRTGSAAQQEAMTEVALEVFLAYPMHYLIAVPVGLYRLLVDVTYWSPLLSIGWNVPLLALSAIGLWTCARTREWARASFLLLPCLYFIAGTLVIQTSSIDTRARVMITPLLAVMAAWGVMHLLNRRRAASASPSPPADS